MIKVLFTRQFLRFLMSGGLAALLHWLSRLLLSQWMPFEWAVFLAYGVGMTVAFVLNFFFVFPQASQTLVRQIVGFALVNLGFLPLVWLASIHIRDVLSHLRGVSHAEAIAHGLAVMLPTLITFLIYKYITFRNICHEQ